MDDHMLKTVLVALDGSACSFTATTLALDWARRFDARLLGLGIVDEASIHRPEPVPLGAGAYKKARDEARMAAAHRRAAEFLEDFRGRASAIGIRSDLLEERGDPAERILFEAQRADVVILGRETHFNFETPARRDATLAQVVRSSPRPMVVVPQTLPEGTGVFVAYGGGREAARTLQLFALLGLAADDTLDVTTIHRDSARSLAPPATSSRHTTSSTAYIRWARPPPPQRSCSRRLSAGGRACSSWARIASIRCVISSRRR